jgi:hypothetical protein
MTKEARMKRLIALALGVFSLFLGALSAVAAADQDTQPMRWHMQTGLPHGTPVADGAVARMVRTENGISYSITTEMLEPGHAYTVWLVVVNSPASCAASPCSAADILANPATDAQVTYGTGHVVGTSGRSGFGGTLRRGADPGRLAPRPGPRRPARRRGAPCHQRPWPEARRLHAGADPDLSSRLHGREPADDLPRHGEGRRHARTEHLPPDAVRCLPMTAFGERVGEV